MTDAAQRVTLLYDQYQPRVLACDLSGRPRPGASSERLVDSTVEQAAPGQVAIRP